VTALLSLVGFGEPLRVFAANDWESLSTTLSINHFIVNRFCDGYGYAILIFYSNIHMRLNNEVQSYCFKIVICMVM
jgi:hypothetical protein